MKVEDTALILLASGQSRRFGAADKLAADLAGTPLALHAATAVSPLSWRRKMVTLGNDRLTARFAELGYEVLVNEDAHAGMSDNLARAASRLKGEAGAMVLLADMPFVTAAHVEAVLRAGGEGQVIVSSRGATRSPPVLFAATQFNALKELTGDEGARRVVGGSGVKVIEVQTDARTLFDIDTPDDLDRARRMIEISL